VITTIEQNGSFHVTGTTPDEINVGLDAAVELAWLHAANEGRHGILVTRHHPTSTQLRSVLSFLSASPGNERDKPLAILRRFACRWGSVRSCCPRASACLQPLRTRVHDSDVQSPVRPLGRCLRGPDHRLGNERPDRPPRRRHQPQRQQLPAQKTPTHRQYPTIEPQPRGPVFNWH
jgi:hypothetical protein